MKIFRPAALSDFDAFCYFAQRSSLGMMSLPKNKDLLKQRLELSVASFSKQTSTPNKELYFFVLEDLGTNQIEGCSGIYAKTGILHPCRYWKIENIQPKGEYATNQKTLHLMTPVSFSSGPSEICALYLNQSLRKAGFGKLLSLARFLFIAANRNRFTDTIIAELRGVIDENQHSPFWEGIGHHFLPLSFSEVMQLQETNPQFYKEMFPKYPIYVELLPNNVQEVIGKTHVNSQAALKILLNQGFKYTNEIDLLDAGPKIQANTNQIQTINQSKKIKLIETSEDVGEELFLLSNEKCNTFRACLAPVVLKESNTVILTPETKEALQIKIGDVIRIVT